MLYGYLFGAIGPCVRDYWNELIGLSQKRVEREASEASLSASISNMDNFYWIPAEHNAYSLNHFLIHFICPPWAQPWHQEYKPRTKEIIWVWNRCYRRILSDFIISFFLQIYLFDGILNTDLVSFHIFHTTMILVFLKVLYYI